ncbi:TRAM domain-containing protein [archaeon]|jgi:predicted RNA-binding protein with TRAM domain|nr:TRAM domain-containing protein [archaeon]MBT4397658.1 TRAM domain-containing protein [archaeon]MBT4441646.1 TRAM domain-containing protein [archaeon]
MDNQSIQEGDIVDLTIESTGAKGDGIAKMDNFVIIVPGVKEGETVKVKITRVLKKMAFGEVVEEASEE